MPVKSNPRKKKKTRPVRDGSQLDAAFERELETWKAATIARGRLAQAAFNYQDAETQATIERIMDRLVVGTNGVVTITISGHKKYQPVEMHYLSLNAMWLATEILKDLAFMDIQVANYEFPTMICTECGADVKPPKKKGRKRG